MEKQAIWLLVMHDYLYTYAVSSFNISGNCLYMELCQQYIQKMLLRYVQNYLRCAILQFEITKIRNSGVNYIKAFFSISHEPIIYNRLQSILWNKKTWQSYGRHTVKQSFSVHCVQM